MPISKFAFVCIAAAALAGCNEGIDGKHGSTPSLPSSPSSQTLSSAPAGTTFSLAAHQEAEAFNTTAYVSSAVQRGQSVTDASTQLTKTSTGFNLTIPTGGNRTPQGGTATFDTTAGGNRFLTTNLGDTIVFQPGSQLIYSAYGTWNSGPGAHPAPQLNPYKIGVLAYGIQATQMPTNGSATFTGTTMGIFLLPNLSGTFNGAASLVADFGAGTIAGDLTSLTAIPDTGSAGGRLSDINLNGTIAGVGFSGTAAAGGNASDRNLDLTGSTGTFGGKFDGPGAAELDGTYTLSSGLTVAGAFAATGQATPSGNPTPTAPNSPASALTVPALANVPVGTRFLGTYPYGVRLASGTTDQTTLVYNPFSVTTTASGFIFTFANFGDFIPVTATFNTSAGASDVVAPGQYIGSMQTSSPLGPQGSIQLGVASLSYSTYGAWAIVADGRPAAAPGLNLTTGMRGVVAYGVETPASQLPATGTATYAGNFRGYYSVGNASGAITGGAVALNADFAARTISGAVTNVTITGQDGTTGRLNNIMLTGGQFGATPAESTSFLGTAAPAAATASTTLDVGGVAGGNFGGKFYGPQAAEVAGVVSLSGNNTLVQGAFGAKK